MNLPFPARQSKRSFLYLAFLFLFGFLAGCSNEPDAQIYEFTGGIMGTSYSVKIVADNPSPEYLENTKVEAIAAMTTVDSLMSTYKNDSELSKLNRWPIQTPFKVDPLTFDVLSMAQDISQRSAGSFDVTVGPVVNLWGFGPEGRPEKVPSRQEIELAEARVGYQYFKLERETRNVVKEKNVYIDLSAIAKGYAVDKVAESLEKTGVRNYLVEIGGELRASGVKPGGSPWVLAVEKPVLDRDAFKKLSINGQGLATSGDYRNYFEENGVRYSHTIDPKTGQPVQHRLASVTVIAATCAEADALATTLLVMGEITGYEFAAAEGIAAYFIYRDREKFSEKMTGNFSRYILQ
ncbi:MAG: FAD:protein FMN transferase [Pseudomonadales bacterium]|nr:FAD:protein FMN transferase [Pseudomonadales bacterium]